MMLITIDGCYLIDRGFNFRRVQMRFPCKPTNDVCFHCFEIKLVLDVLMQTLTFGVTFFFSIFCQALAEKTHTHHHYTLLDGEMIIDTLPDSHKQERRYLIYDLIAINSMPVIEVWFICFLCCNSISFLFHFFSLFNQAILFAKICYFIRLYSVFSGLHDCLFYEHRKFFFVKERRIFSLVLQISPSLFMS